MTDHEIIQWLKDEYAQPFRGWNFSRIADRRRALGSLPWDYESIAAAYLGRATSMLDIDTGGGEVLARLLAQSGFTGSGHAIEPHKPNVAVSQSNLGAHKIEVHDTSSHSPRFNEGAFDLILSRHGGSIPPAQISDHLGAGGHLVTEQIGDRTNRELRELFAASMQPGVAWPRNQDEVADAFGPLGLEIARMDSHEYPVRFLDVGALVYYLKAVPWEVPGFSIDAHSQTLIKLHREAEARGYAIDATFHAYLVVAAKR